MAKLIKLEEKAAADLWNQLATLEGDKYSSWRESCINNRKFYYGDQYTDEEIEILSGKGQYSIVINKVRKAIRGLSGLMSANVPKYKLLSLDDDDCVKAAIGNKLLDWVWTNSDGLATYANILKNALIDNIAYMHVILDGKKVKFVQLSFDDVVVDPNSTHRMFEDASIIAIRKHVSVDYVKQVYGVKDIYTELPGGNFGSFSPVITANGEFISKVFDTSKQYVRIYECYRKQYYRKDNGDITNKIIKDTVLGFMHVYTEELPPEITEYPVIPVYVEGGENPYKLGEVEFLKELQRFINKAFGITLLNAQLMSNPKIVTNEESVSATNRKAFEENYSRPNAIAYLNGNSSFFTVVSGQPLNQAFYSLYLDAKNEFDLATLPQQILGYQDSSKYQSDSQILDKKETVLDSFKDFMYIIDSACCKLARVSLQFIQGYLSKESAISIVGADSVIERIKTSRQEGLDVENEESVQRFIQYQRSQKVDEEDIESIIAKAKNDSEYVKSLFYVIDNTDFTSYDISIIPGSYTPTYQMAMMRLMMELTSAQAVDPSMILDYAPIENRKELKERYDTINRLNAQVEGLIKERDHAIEIAQEANSRVSSVEQGAIVEKTQIKMNKLASEMKIKSLMQKYNDRLTSREERLKLAEQIAQARLKFDAEVLKMKLELEQASKDLENGNSNSVLELIYGTNENQGE